MNVSSNGLLLIQKHEGFSDIPYLCPAGVPTIGYGATFYPNGVTVTLNDPEISKLKATEYLKIMVQRYESGVRRYVNTNLKQNQFDALVSFAYNLGLGSLQRSTLLKLINKNSKDKKIFNEFLRWNRANGKILNGLKRRRLEEAKLYFRIT